MTCDCQCCAGRCGCALPCANTDQAKKDAWRERRRDLNSREGPHRIERSQPSTVGQVYLADIARWKKK